MKGGKKRQAVFKTHTYQVKNKCVHSAGPGRLFCKLFSEFQLLSACWVLYCVCSSAGWGNCSIDLIGRVCTGLLCHRARQLNLWLCLCVCLVSVWWWCRVGELYIYMCVCTCVCVSYHSVRAFPEEWPPYCRHCTQQEKNPPVQENGCGQTSLKQTRGGTDI